MLALTIQTCCSPLNALDAEFHVRYQGATLFISDNSGETKGSESIDCWSVTFRWDLFKRATIMQIS